MRGGSGSRWEQRGALLCPAIHALGYTTADAVPEIGEPCPGHLASPRAYFANLEAQAIHLTLRQPPLEPPGTPEVTIDIRHRCE
jgi:hypothetical protein